MLKASGVEPHALQGQDDETGAERGSRGWRGFSVAVLFLPRKLRKEPCGRSLEKLSVQLAVLRFMGQLDEASSERGFRG